MKVVRKILYLLFLSLFIVSCSFKEKEPEFKEESKEETNENLTEKEKKEEKEEKPKEQVKTKKELLEELLEEKINIKINEMTLREKISQTLILGFDETEMSDHLKYIIEDIKPGGFILFDNNIVDKDQVINLNKSIYKINSLNDNIPLFISVDEEGGIVSRLSKIYGKLPNMVELGNIDKEDISFLYGEILGLRLKTLGFNLDFAPVSDINSNPNNPVIGARSFGNNKDVVSRNSIKVMEGIKSKDILSTVKHFPGHGDTSIDSHFDVPLVSKSIEEIRDFELIPFKSAIENDVDMIMVGHILYDKIDENNISSLSKVIKEKLLRYELFYSGVVISDDLTMKAVLKNITIEEAAYKFIKTGGDIALICHNTKEIHKTVDYIENKIKSNNFTENELNTKVKRILMLKEKYKLNDNYVEDENEINEIQTLQEDLFNKLSE